MLLLIDNNIATENQVSQI